MKVALVGVVMVFLALALALAFASLGRGKTIADSPLAHCDWSDADRAAIESDVTAVDLTVDGWSWARLAFVCEATLPDGRQLSATAR